MSDTSRSGDEGAVGEGPVADARGLADMSSDVLIVVAPDLTVRRASSAAAGVLGRDPAEMAGAAIRPGHPVRLARLGGTPVLALPGNPISAVVCMTLFGRPLLGRDDALAGLPLAVAHRAGTARTDLLRCTLGPDGLVPAPRQASHDISGLAVATHLAVRPPEPRDLDAGSILQSLRIP